MLRSRPFQVFHRNYLLPRRFLQPVWIRIPMAQRILRRCCTSRTLGHRIRTATVLDGNEVFHLYNPAGQAPVRLLDSSLVKIVTASIGWVMSIPASWSIAMDSTDGSRATIDTKHGELFKITIENNSKKKPILQWYLDTHPSL